MKNPKEYAAKLAIMQELDFGVATEFLYKKINDAREAKGWTWDELGALVGKTRAHCCEAGKLLIDMRTTNLLKFAMAFDWNMCDLQKEMMEQIYKAPRKLK